MNHIRTLKHWDRGFESHSMYGFLSEFVLCLGTGLATGWYPVQGVLPTVYWLETGKAAKVHKGSRTIDRYVLEDYIRVCVLLSVHFWMALQPLWALATFQSPDLFKIVGTPWTSDHLVTGGDLNTGQHKHTKNTCTPNIHSLIGIRTHDHNVWASEDSSYLRPLDCRDRLSVHYTSERYLTSLLITRARILMTCHLFYFM
jgi:hypothetical protein